MSYIYRNRIERLQDKIAENTAAYITNEVNIRYFCGLAKSEGAMIISKNAAVLLVDFRYIEAAENACGEFCTVCMCSDNNKYLYDFADKNDVTDILIEDDTATLRQFQRVKTGTSRLNFITDSTLTNAIKSLRIVKDSSEIEFLKKAQGIAEASYLELLNMVKVGVSERTLAVELEYLMKKNGAEGISFDLITIAGKNTSKPHGVPSDYEIQNGDFVTFDIGATFNGYHSDMTRTIAVGFATDEMCEIYEIVRTAQSEALKSVRAGVTAKDCDGVARGIIADAGYADKFGHSTGHGVGLDIHEYPVLSPKSEEVLIEGMIVTVEPGIYLLGKFGVRIEDMVCVTENGCENLTKIEKTLIIV